MFSKKGERVAIFNETLANGFAAFILMPTKLITQKWAEVKDPDQIARIFLSPKPAVNIRLRLLGLI